MPPARPVLRPLLACALVTAVASPAAAHTPYLAPLNFAPSRDYVTVTGGMFEETALVSDFALRGSGFFETGPDGRTAEAPAPAGPKGMNVFDAPLPAPGTYRISTGDRAGREASFAEVGGVWRPIRGAPPPAGAGAPRPARREGGEGPEPLDAAPPGAPVVHSASFLRAETYVTRGAPSDAALKPAGAGLEFAPVTHPNGVYLDKPFGFRLLLDGRPVPAAAVLVRRADEAYADRKTELHARTDAAGRAEVKFPLAGVYVLEARFPAASAPGARPPEKSYVSTLTLEATP